eukprot:TRINITY_DN4216_c0_g1_i3.p1 TRINITY_DN4216_c0_g1~~TRINITY_DN4216_c0_g1_i3.p1  ORF type:complete len:474 (+),score=57.65 TRINITY_DN4216_c0_g1_i3:68-1489(+)
MIRFVGLFTLAQVFFFFNDTATTEIYTLHIVGSVRCVQETDSKRYMSVAGGMFLHLVFGTQYLWGNIIVYVTSYYHNNYDHSLTIADANLAIPLGFLALAISIPLGLPLSKYTKVKPLLIVITIMIPSIVFASSYIQNFYFFVIIYTFVQGIFSGFGYMLPFDICYTYFPKKKGVVAGAVSSCYGFGCFIFSLVALHVINPKNLKTDESGFFPPSVANNVPKCLRILSGIFLFFLIIGTVLIQVPTESDKEKIKEIDQAESVNQSENESQKLIMNTQSSIDDPLDQCPSVGRALRHPMAYLQFFQFICFAAYGAFISSVFKLYGQQFSSLNSDAYLTLVGSLGSVCNGLRIIWGILIEKLSFKQLSLLNLCTQFVVILTLRWIVFSKALFAISVMLSYFCYGGTYPVMPTISTRLFGQKNGLRAYGVIYQADQVTGWMEFIFVMWVLPHMGHDLKEQYENCLLYTSPSPRDQA